MYSQEAPALALREAGVPVYRDTGARHLGTVAGCGTARADRRPAATGARRAVDRIRLHRRRAACWPRPASTFRRSLQAVDRGGSARSRDRARLPGRAEGAGRAAQVRRGRSGARAREPGGSGESCRRHGSSGGLLRRADGRGARLRRADRRLPLGPAPRAGAAARPRRDLRRGAAGHRGRARAGRSGDASSACSSTCAARRC